MVGDMSTGMHEAAFCFHGYLAEFRPSGDKGSRSTYRFPDNPGIKDPIEALGVPHTEVDAIVVNGTGVDFRYQLRHGDEVSVYPRTVKPSAAAAKPLRPPLDPPRFVLDVHLGKLARYLRLLGQDTRYSNRFEDPELVDISVWQNRALLTRDRRLLYHRRIVHGHFVRPVEPEAQVREVVNHYNLRDKIAPFSRCINCNGRIVSVDKADVLHRLEPKTARYYRQFYQCRDCEQVYWKGTHFEGLRNKLGALGISI